MQLIKYILHYFTGCPDESVSAYKNNATICQECGRITFIFKQ